jgi:hypothetical protein
MGSRPWVMICNEAKRDECAAENTASRSEAANRNAVSMAGVVPQSVMEVMFHRVAYIRQLSDRIAVGRRTSIQQEDEL